MVADSKQSDCIEVYEKKVLLLFNSWLMVKKSILGLLEPDWTVGFEGIKVDSESSFTGKTFQVTSPPQSAVNCKLNRP